MPNKDTAPISSWRPQLGDLIWCMFDEQRSVGFVVEIGLKYFRYLFGEIVYFAPYEGIGIYIFPISHFPLEE